MKILLTGGHATVALAVIDALQKETNINLSFVGRSYTSSIMTEKTFEYSEVTKRNIPFYHLESGRLTRGASIDIFRQILLLIKGIWQSFVLLNAIKPDIVFSFGGFLALPVVVVAWVRGCKIVTHEQTIVPGKANRIIALFATRIYLSFDETKKYFSPSKSILVGCPIREALKIEEENILGKISKPILLVMGGQLGSHAINEMILEQLDELKKYFVIVHQTGNVGEFNDFEKCVQLSDENYHVYKHLDTSQMASILRNACLYVGRSGANIFFELIYFKLPSVLIPLAISAGGEQLKQAQILEKAGVSFICDQTEGSQALLAKIIKAHETYLSKKTNFSKLEKLNPKNSIVLLISDFKANFLNN